MANTFLIKRSTVSGKSPASADLVLGELALNVADGRLFCKRTDGTIFVINPQYGLTPSVVSLDMGSLAVQARSFTVSVPGVSMNSEVICSVSGDMANGAFIDELEFEPLTVFGRVSATNTLEFTVATSHPFGLTSGIKYINFYVG